MKRSTDAHIHLIFELVKVALVILSIGTAVGLISYYKSTPPPYSILAAEFVKQPTHIINGDVHTQSIYYGTLPN